MYKVGDVVKLDTKPIIYGKVLHFVKVSKKNDVDKVVVQRQPEEVGKLKTKVFFFRVSTSKNLAFCGRCLGCHLWSTQTNAVKETSHGQNFSLRPGS